MSSVGDSEPDAWTYASGSEKLHTFSNDSVLVYMVIKYHKLEHEITSVLSHCNPHGNVCA